LYDKYDNDRLGLAVAQQYAIQRMPHGRYRAREETTAPRGFFLPVKITNPDVSD
jgi:hypothetical protein